MVDRFWDWKAVLVEDLDERKRERRREGWVEMLQFVHSSLIRSSKWIAS